MILDNKCTRCGKHLKIKGVTEINSAVCVHCNKEHTITKKAKRKSLFLYIIIAFVAMFFFSVLQLVFKWNFLIMLAIVFLAALGFSMLANYLMVKFNWLDYEGK